MFNQKAKAEVVANCQRNCAFIVTERHAMLRKPWKPIWWIIKINTEVNGKAINFE